MHSGSSVSETHVAVKLHILKEEEIRETINRSNILSLVCGLIFTSLVILRSLVNLDTISCFSNSPFKPKSKTLPKYLKLSPIGVGEGENFSRKC